MENKMDIFDYLGINGREDSYTDFVKSVFDRSDEFKENLKNRFFDDTKNSIEMLIRTCYFTPKGKSRKVIPDVILVCGDHFVIIEVKIFSGEGWCQLDRYNEAREEISKQLKERYKRDFVNSKFDIYFLTLDGTTSDFAKSIKWQEICNMMPSTINDDRLQLCVNDFKKRIRDYYDDLLIDLDGNFYDVYKAHQFIGYGSILKKLFVNRNYEIWEEWNDGQNRYAATIQINNELWTSKNNQIEFEKDLDEKEIITNKDTINAKNNYDIHYEIQVFWNDNTEKWRLQFRIDYHTYPYLSKKDLKYFDMIYMYNDRKKFINDVKDILINKYNVDKNLLPLKVDGSNLWIYSNEFDIEKDTSISKFINIIDENIEKTKPYINELIKIIKE